MGEGRGIYSVAMFQPAACNIACCGLLTFVNVSENEATNLTR